MRPDRRRLLLFTTAVMAGVGVASVGFAVWSLRDLVEASLGFDPWLHQRLINAQRNLVAATLLGMIGGGALLLRVITPFAERLEASEARTSAIVAHAVDGILTIDASGTIGSMNPASERLFGYEAAAVVGAQLRLLVPRLEGEALAATISPRWPEQDGTPSFQAETGRRRDGSHVALEISVARLGDLVPVQYTLVLRDVTERQRAEDQLRIQAEALRSANAALEAQTCELQRINHELNDFTYIASHDLKEPLRGIAAYCRMLAEDSADQLDDEGRRRLETLERLALRSERLAGDLLTYARVGCCRPELGPVALSEVVADVLQTLEPLLHGAQAQVEVPAELPVVRGDATLLGEVFRNLVANGVKFNRGAPRIEIGCDVRDTPTFWVRDNGIGIPAEHHEAVFEMFRRLHRRSEFEGTGAGLAIVRKIVRAHGGRTWLESAPDAGTTVYFTLPQSSAPSSDSEAGSPLLGPHFATLVRPGAERPGVTTGET
ncbi:MAG: PAS domain S-box protein [Pirellulales bacterium]|nr:PAS domain S-box protein [Pirellulales bacterium]